MSTFAFNSSSLNLQRQKLQILRLTNMHCICLDRKHVVNYF